MTDNSDRYPIGEVTEQDRVRLAALILQLRSQGIRDHRVLSAIEQIPRRLFLDAENHDLAYIDRALPIDCGQTISAPSIVAQMTEALGLEAHHRVLEIGTGSGYQTAVLAKLVEHVYSIERFKTLRELAAQRLATLRIDNVTLVHGDGFEGLPDKAPFDRIIVTAAAPEVPETLVMQLVSRGIMVLPVGSPGGVQRLLRVIRRGSHFDAEELCLVRFVPMIPGVAARM
ncbi:MAG: protein-L-isoaspartate O-methyltransferase [Hyphomicrobiales bacterium]|nr:MAG: protein-L-isoaspartate O-methyltransferase [Hyphomicrobiales bacterium]